MKQTTITTLGILLFLTGCGGGESFSNSTYEGVMKPDTEYTLFPGDRIERESDNARIQITHAEQSEESTVILLSGSARIIRSK